MGSSAFMFLVLLLIGNLEFSTISADPNPTCIKNEQETLLKIKQGFNDTSNRFSSWNIAENCCTWKGVSCSNRTGGGHGHVIKLDLSNQSNSTSLQGQTLPNSLLNLTHLQSLDLSYNNFSGAVIPTFLGSMHNLTYLNLSCSNLEGKVPQNLGNLSNLQYLDLSWNYGLRIDNLDWTSILSWLKVLDLSGLNLSMARNWLHSLNMIPSLLELHLSSCQIPHMPLLPHTNLTSLAVLDLSNNNFTTTIPTWLVNATNIQYLNLSMNNFRGSVPSGMGNYELLQVLDLSYNELEGEITDSVLKHVCNFYELSLAHNRFSGEISGSFRNTTSGCSRRSNLKSLVLETNFFSGFLPQNLGDFKHLELLNLYSNTFRGPIPESIGELSSLKVLYLSHNLLNGSVPESLGQLSTLEILDLHNNSLVGTLSEIHFSKLRSLTTLNLYRNPSLVFNVSQTWIPPFQIQNLALFSCIVGPKFPQWIQTQTNLTILEMQNTSISDSIPDWFEDITSSIILLDLSNNKIGKNLPKLRQYFGSTPYRFVYLGSNKFDCPLTPFPSDVVELDISNNFLWGHIPETIDTMVPRLTMLLLSNNYFNGTVPASLCKMKKLRYVDISGNHLSGRIPECWSRSQQLNGLDISNNSISGHIPSSLGSLVELQSLHLKHNSLQGKIPDSLKKLNQLQILDLSENAFEGVIPSWIGENFSSLRVLSLRSNRFDGQIPDQLCRLSLLRILNLANNNLTGTIPDCLGNFTAMTGDGRSFEEYWLYRPTIFGRVFGFQSFVYNERILVYIKGIELEYTRTLSYLFSIDISSNNMDGEIPAALTSLSGLQNLNLSRNNLTGHIPPEIGNMKSLESLDFSRNELSGSIPPTISALNFLSHLNLSFNSFSGRIPSGNQIQTLDDRSAYMGNAGLCGPPLDKCQEDEEQIKERNSDDDDDDDGDEFDILGFYSGLGMGFAVGFVGVCVILYFQDSWRNAYFDLIEKFAPWFG